LRNSWTTPNPSHCRAMLLALIPLMLPVGSPCASEVYKSVDADGHVVYSDRASTSTAQKSTVRIDEPDPKEVARNAREHEILKAEEIQRNKKQSVDDAKKAQQDHNRQAQCDLMRNHYYALKDARRIYDRDADGNRVFLSDADADLKREEARLATVAACGT
jgi:hypothetical protein